MIAQYSTSHPTPSGRISKPSARFLDNAGRRVYGKTFLKPLFPRSGEKSIPNFVPRCVLSINSINSVSCIPTYSRVPLSAVKGRKRKAKATNSISPTPHAAVSIETPRRDTFPTLQRTSKVVAKNATEQGEKKHEHKKKQQQAKKREKAKSTRMSTEGKSTSKKSEKYSHSLKKKKRKKTH